jgi:2-dehydro-3-deoxygalactonokinase
MPGPSHIISCDWGTTSLRLRLVHITAFPQILAEYRCDEGAAALAATSTPETRPACFEGALRRSFESLAMRTSQPLDGLPVVISGMASSSVGWISLPYSRLPFDLNGQDAVVERLKLDDHPILLISGVRDELDVMRGEETELLGLMQLPEARALASRCIAVLPGTHSKHVNIAGGKIVSFRTAMTGELFSVLASHSVLRHSVCSGDRSPSLPRQAAGPAREAFVQGVQQSLESDLPSSLFRVRTRQLLQGEPPALNAAYLSGLLIGSEVGALRRRNLDEPIVLCAGSAVAEWYAAALETAGLGNRTVAIAAETVDQLSAAGHAMIQRLGVGAREGKKEIMRLEPEE